MNYLAHIYLSGNDRQRQVGNFIGDFVKGNRYEEYPAKIREGILLHRQIDSFTDSHPLVLDAIAMLRPEFGRYSGIITDVFFDHLLASGFRRYAKGQSLRCVSANFYYATLRYYPLLPSRVKGFLWHFISTNRLMRYASYDGLQEAFTIMSNYKVPALRPEETVTFLKKNHAELEEHFAAFFPELEAFVQDVEI
jgi:acyl carrier protein phosphodiesterase